MLEAGIYVPNESAFAHSYRDGHEVLTGGRGNDGFAFAQLLPGNKLLWEQARELTVSPEGEVRFTGALGYSHLPQPERDVFDLGAIDRVSQQLYGDSGPKYLRI